LSESVTQLAWLNVKLFLQHFSSLTNQIKKKFNKVSLFSFTSNLIFVILIVCCSILSTKVNFLDLRLIDTYPNYLWVFAFHHLSAPSTLIATMMMIYGRNSQLRKFVKQEFKEKLRIRTSVVIPSNQWLVWQ
jgi:hypothetical protein